MKVLLIGLAVFVIFLLALAVCIWFLIRYLKKKMNRYSHVTRAADMLVKGMQLQEADNVNKPSNVSGMTSVYLPQIMNDFPQFHLEEMRERAESVLCSYLQSLQEGNPELLTEGTKELKDQLNMKIRSLKSIGSKVHYEQVKIHRTEIHKYRKASGRLSIVFQSAVGYVCYTETNGRITKGKKDTFTQSRYNVEVSYIQDRDLVGESMDTGKALNCPNCGGVISSLGEKVCRYCGSVVMEYNIRTWAFTDVEVVK